MAKIAFIDLDGVVANSVLRFEKAAKNGKINWALAFHPPMLSLATLIRNIIFGKRQNGK
ncbi:hypothetical protein [Candidatus Chlorohelix sp.]|uniref:hypothetical protein n=1 Tax=Candidatus Chlorohelix sp. TaxID=3139201 RepID=UPI00303E7CC8